MHESWRKALSLLLAVGLVVSLGVVSGCQSTTDEPEEEAPEEAQAVSGGTLRYYIGNPAYLDPYNAQESEGMQVTQSLFDSLTSVDFLDPEKLNPAAAESWEPNEDATVWTFSLNPDGKFSDGTPVTANDFIYAWNRIANPETINTATDAADPSIISYHLAAVKGFDAVAGGEATEMEGLKAVDDYTLEVTLAEPFAEFDYVVAHPALAPVPQAAVEEGVDYNGEQVAYGLMPIGNGPFKMSEPWKDGQYVKVVRNDEYAGDEPYIDGIDFMIFKDPNTAYTEFQAGNLDFCQIGEGQIEAAVEQYGESPNGYTVNPGEQALLGAENAIYYLLMNNEEELMKNADLRKAVSLAINRQAICDTVFEGTREPADNIIPPGIAGYEEGAWVDSKYDVDGAKAALEAAGYPEGEGLPTLTLSFNNDGGHESIMQLIQADLSAIGIETEFQSADFPTYLKQLDAADYQLGRLGWIADYPIMDNFLYPLFQSESTDNKAYYKNTDVDGMLAEARGITDQSARLEKYNEANDTIQSVNPVAPVMFYRHHHIGSDRVHELTYSPDGLCDFVSTWIAEDGGSSESETSE